MSKQITFRWTTNEYFPDLQYLQCLVDGIVTDHFTLGETKNRLSYMTPDRFREKCGDAKYEWSGFCNGRETWDNFLQADILDDAKKELEDWCLQQLSERVQRALKELGEALDVYGHFLQWRENHT